MLLLPATTPPEPYDNKTKVVFECRQEKNQEPLKNWISEYRVFFINNTSTSSIISDTNDTTTRLISIPFIGRFH